jgi:modulator of FtsH protease HflC
MKRPLSLWISSVLIVVALGLHSSTIIVEEGSMVLHTRFGKVVESIIQPGLYFKWPWPIDDTQVFLKRRFLYEGQDEQVLTKDQNSLIVSNHVIWNILPERLSEFRERVQSVENFQTRLESRLRSCRNGLFGSRSFDELFGAKGGLVPLEEQLLADLKSSLLQDFGVEVQDVGFTHLGLAPAVLESVYAKMNAERERISAHLKSEGDSEATRIEAEAQSKYDQAMAKIDGEARQIIGQAEADSIEAYRLLSQHSELALELKKLESLEALLKGRSTLVLDRNTPPLDILNESK